jgi:hypothetical protein
MRCSPWLAGGLVPMIAVPKPESTGRAPNHVFRSPFMRSAAWAKSGFIIGQQF